MQKSPVLVDSSYYIALTRRGIDPLPMLAYLAMDRGVATCGMVRAEVGRGLKFPRVRQTFHAAWNVMLNVITDNQLWDEAEQMAWTLDRQGTVLPMTDIVIACCAKRLGAVVLTHDGHFKEIPGLKVAMTLDELL
jgi:predicted nucleic acid-binding protein